MFVGFDYGSSNCAMGVLNEERVQLIPLEQGKHYLPSTLYTHHSALVVDFVAQHLQGSEHEHAYKTARQPLLNTLPRIKSDLDLQAGDDTLFIGREAINEYVQFPEEGYFVKSPKKLAVYECKCWGNLSIQELDKTIKKFKQNDLLPNLNKYVIILAQEEVPRNISKKWHQIHQELHALGVESELWTAVTLTTMSQPYPDIVSKFFPMAPESQFYNEWMLRTHFIETLHKALIDPDENNREAAKEFLDFSSLNYSDFDEYFFEDGNWKIKKKWIEISALLPTQNHVGSATITVKTLICAELAGDFHLGYARQLTDKSSLLFDLAF